MFLITLLILLAAGAVTFGLIAWATPSTYTAVVTDDLTAQVDQLVDQLDGTEEQSCGPLLDAVYPHLRGGGHAGGAGRPDCRHRLPAGRPVGI